MKQQGRHSDRFCGVKGWLRLIVVGNLYVAPPLVGLQYFFAWGSFVLMAGDYPGIVVIGLILTCIDGFLMYLGIQAAMALRDIRAGAVQQMKHLLKLRLGVTLLGAPLLILGWSLCGLDANDLIPKTVRGGVLNVIGIAIGLAYFSMSRRVKATYPDWNAKV